MSTTTTAMNTVKARRLVVEMPEYHPPLAERTALRLDFNENTFGPSPRVMERLQKVTAEGLTKYPEREGVERIVAQHFGLAPAQVLLTNGVDEAIHLMCCAFLEADDEALICTCFCVSERTIEREIQDNNLRTIAEVTRACNAGGGCRSCYPLIEEMLASKS